MKEKNKAIAIIAGIVVLVAVLFFALNNAFLSWS